MSLERGLRLMVAALIAVGAVARLAPLFDQSGRLLQQFPSEDAYLPLTVARNLALGHGLSVSDGTVPATGVQPLAALLWAACFWVVGGAKKTGVLLVLVAELLIGAGSALGLWQLAERALAGTRHAGLAALLAAAAWWASPSVIPHAMDALPTGLTAGLVILVALAFIAPGTERPWSLGRQLRFGVALGLAFLARADTLLLGACAALVHLTRPIEGRGRAPLRRAGEALVFSAVSLAVAAAALQSGRLAPLELRFANHLSQVPGVLVELATLFAPLPPALQSNPLVVAGSWLCCGLGCAAAFAAWRRADATGRALVLLAGLFAVSLAALYGLGFGAGQPMARSLLPVSPFLAIAWAWAVVGARPVLRGGALAAALALALAANARLYAAFAEPKWFEAVHWVDANVPDEVWLGARESPALGFFHDRTLSLDGAARARVEDIVAKRLPYLVGGAAAGDLLREPPIAARYDVLVRDGAKDLVVLKLKPPEPPAPASAQPDTPE